MTELHPIDIKTWDANVFRAFDDGWALLGVKTPSGIKNAMTVSWGGTGILWHKPVFSCFVRPQRYTYGLALECTRLSLSFFGGQHREELQMMGSLSGRDTDKLDKSGLAVTETSDALWFDDACAVLVGKILYHAPLLPAGFQPASLADSLYPARDFHEQFIVEIEQALVR